MPSLILYLIKLSISLSIVFLFYQLVLRRLTFYAANRWYLVAMSMLSFFVPFINVTSIVDDTNTNNGLMRFIPAVQEYSIGLEEATVCPMPLWSTNWTKWDWMLLAFVIGIALLFIRLFVRCISFYRLRNRAKLIAEDGWRIYQVDEAIIPFSFGNSIFINSTQHTESELREIIRHEFIHVKQRHTFDILWAEILCMLNWYNPAAWLLKNSIRQNLEFIADHQVLENGVDKKQYQYLLLKVIGNDQFSIAQKFNFSSLKKRIAMMNKTKSARVHLLRFLVLLPILALILISFRSQFGKPDTAPVSLEDTIPDVKTPNEKGFIINIKDNKGQCMVVIKDRNGKLVDKLPLTTWNENAATYEGKFGEIPPPPPPKTPLPPSHPTKPAPHADQGIPVPAMPADAPHPPVPPTKQSEKLLTLANEFEITDKQATLRLKDGTTEKYDLTKPEQRAKFESKWGRIIEPSEDAPIALVHGADGEAVMIPLNSPIPTEGVMAVTATGALITGKEDVLITITKYTKRSQLEEFKKQMKAKDVDLSFDEIEYDAKGLLVTLSGSMKSKDGRSNFVASDFEKLVLAMVRSGDRTYFKVNTSNKKEVVKAINPKQPAKPIQASQKASPVPAPVKPSFLFSPYPAQSEKDKC